jgi:MraZ protein
MFSNQYTHSVDSKGRLALPARWLRELGASVFITRGLDGCLFLFPADRFHALARDIAQLGFIKSDARALSRYLFSEALDHRLDRQGRISLPPNLLAFAGIEREVTIVGANNRIEIWNPQRYAEEDAKVTSQVSAMSERISDLLLRTPAAEPRKRAASL